MIEPETNICSPNEVVFLATAFITLADGTEVEVWESRAQEREVKERLGIPLGAKCYYTEDNDGTNAD